MKIDASPIITSARTVAVLSGPDSNFDDALKWAKANGTRLFTRAEAQYLFETSEEFCGSVRNVCFWVLESAAVNSSIRACAWYFGGNYANVYANDRGDTAAVRCVGQSNE